MGRQVLLPLLLGLTVPWALPAQEGPRLAGDGRPDHVRLMWLLDEWPPDLDGFVLRRRSQGGSWEPLHPGVIRPRTDLGDDLEKVESDPRARGQALAKLRDLVGSGELAAVGSGEMIATLSADPAAAGLWSFRLIGDFDFALATGFGFVDRSAKAAPGVLEYGLFAVRSGAVDREPSSIYRWTAGVESLPDLDLTLEVRRIATDSLAVRWTYDARRSREEQVAGFRIYRRQGSELRSLHSDGFLRTAGGSSGRGTYVDDGRDTERPATYAVAPVDAFGREGPRHETTWDPRAVPEALAAPRILAAKRAGPGAEVVLKWDFDGAGAARLAGFTVTRRGAAGSDAIEVEAAERELVDRDDKPLGEWYSYTVTAHGVDGAEATSAAAAVYLPLVETPPIPRDFRGRVTMRDGELYVRLEWAPADPSDAVTAGYTLYANSPPDRRMWRQASLGDLGTIRGNSIEVPVYTSDPALYLFQLAAKSAGNDESPRTPVLEVRVGATSLPPIALSGIEPRGDRLLVTWEYESIPDLAGFRIYFDGQVAADTDVLGAETRRWISAPLAGGREALTVEVEAVSKLGITKRSFSTRFRLPRKR